MTMADFIANLASATLTPTKTEFGEKMHDESVSEEEKQEILEAVEMAGGYDNLED